MATTPFHSLYFSSPRSNFLSIWNWFVGLITDGLLLFHSWTGNAGLAIILFTIFIRILLLPLTMPALRNSRRQQQLAPQVREIQKKHGKDRTAATAETMALYRQYGFNPMSGCLPILVQMPVFFALWRAIVTFGSPERSVGGFLWIDNLAAPEEGFFGFLKILPILAMAAQFVQTRMSLPPHGQALDPQQQSMNRMMQFMPLLVVVFGWNISAGAVLYWFISSLFSAVLQYFITGWGSLKELMPFLPHKEPRNYLPAPRPISELETSGRKGFMQRMQDRMLEAQREQEARRSGAAEQRAPASPPAVQPAAATAEGDIRYTSDAWRLPGAPGTKGRLSAMTTSGGPEPQPDGGTHTARARPSSRKRKRR